MSGTPVITQLKMTDGTLAVRHYQDVEDILEAGIAVINSIGNLAGFAGPFAMGWIKDHTGSYTGGLLLLAGLGIIAMGIVLSLNHNDELERAPATASK